MGMNTSRHGFCWEGGRLSRRDAIQLGALGLTLPGFLSLSKHAWASAPVTRGGFGRAKSCIVLFAWGGMSHVDTWDMKPDAASNVRSDFTPIKTSTPGIQLCEHMPHTAKQTHRMAIVRSVHHTAPAHRVAAYWNLTGHAPSQVDRVVPASRNEWPCLGAQVAYAKHDGGAAQTNLPLSVSLPSTIVDGGYGNGQDGGFLGLGYDPVVAKPTSGKPYDGKSPEVGAIELELAQGISRQRLISRRGLLASLETAGPGATVQAHAAERFRHQAMNMLLDPTVRDAFNTDSEPQAVREAYGDHVCGQSVLLARKLTESGVPLVTVYCGAGDLNGSVGAHWDTHADGFNRLKNQMLPPLDQAGGALLDDLASRGRLKDTLVVWLTEFGRTPQHVHGGGRDHFPNCYSVAFAGGGVAGGQVYGASDPIGYAPADKACGPEDLHATIFHALGVDPHTTVQDLSGRPFPLCEGKVLPVFG